MLLCCSYRIVFLKSVPDGDGEDGVVVQVVDVKILEYPVSSHCVSYIEYEPVGEVIGDAQRYRTVVTADT